MSRLTELKKQYPLLDMSFFDLMVKMDKSKSYKYIPLLCKLFSKEFELKVMEVFFEDIESNLKSKFIDTQNCSRGELYFIWQLSHIFSGELFSLFNSFTNYIEDNQIENRDITSYNNLDDLRRAVSIAEFKTIDKSYENQVIKEFEDETWVIVRPLTFASSLKYGYSTKWCTTSKDEKSHFERYWRQGVLVYFINKKTGYKFAFFKSVDDNEMSFWNSDDSRVDFLSLDVDEYLYPRIKKIVQSNNTNKSLSSDEIQEKVHSECIHQYLKFSDENDALVNHLNAIPQH